MKLNVKAFALSCGLLCGIGLFVVTWWVILFEGSTGELHGIGHVYRGFNISPVGSVFGLIWGFVDGLIGGAIFAWLYNLLAGRSKGM
ncbi:MAG: bacteriophage holin [Candidatus Zixiibacteriota bacterium]|nr:MAG: bacteriophage holin [candidate division Zixibacteria bacterium]